MLGFQIQDDVPMPSSRQGNKTPLASAMSQIQKGQSFLVPNEKDTNRAVAFIAAKRAGKKIATRKEGIGYRVWCLGSKA